MPTSNPNILLAALGSNVVEVDVEKKRTGRIVAFVSTDDNAEGTRFNDGKATPQGVFIVGRMNRAWRDGQPGKLFAMDLRVPGNSFGLMTILGPTEVRHCLLQCCFYGDACAHGGFCRVAWLNITSWIAFVSGAESLQSNAQSVKRLEIHQNKLDVTWNSLSNFAGLLSKWHGLGSGQGRLLLH